MLLQEGLFSVKNDNKKFLIASTSQVPINRGRSCLEKSHSMPAYDPTESDDDFIEKKFEAALDEHHKQQQRSRARNSDSNSSNKTDSRLFDSIEDLEEHGESLMRTINDPDLDTSKIIGNVAKKINEFEKNLQSRR